MKNFLRLIITFTFCFIFVQTGLTKPFENPIASAIRKSDISRSAMISVSFRELSSAKPAFELNPEVPMNPASIQKIVTLLPSLDTLGRDWEFKTQLYKDKNNYLYLKLGADPYLTNKDLKNMIRALNERNIVTTKAFYIDDSILDSNEWGEGWQWDDDLSPLMPKFGSYNLDSNLITIDICPTAKGAPADITTDIFYPTAFMNNILTGDTNEIRLSRRNYISPDMINADGTVSYDTRIQIPVNYPRRYFVIRLEEILRNQKIAYYGDFTRIKTPQNLTLIAEVKHPIEPATAEILKKSNNMMAETVFKLAGGKYAKETGSVGSAVEMLDAYYKKLGISTDNIKIVDGSGVSKNNLLTADFVTQVLAKESQNPDFDYFKSNMASPGEGTLVDRMLYFKENLKAKTGTLSDVSSIAGYITAKSGKSYAFCIITSDAKSKSSDKKAFEEYVLREAFDKL